MSPTARRAVSGVVLAAGDSSRLGGEVPKQLRTFSGEALVRHAVRAATRSQLQEVLVVVGHASRQVTEAVSDFDVRIIDNPDFLSGQSSSVRAGLAGIAAEAAAALFIPGDQPLLSSQLIDRVITTYDASGEPIVVPICEGRRGAPVLFGRELFFELERLTGDTGGRSVISRYPASIVELEVNHAFELADVDTENDLQRLRRIASEIS